MGYENRHLAAGEFDVAEVVAGDEHHLLIAEPHLSSVVFMYIDAAEELSFLRVQSAHAFGDLQRIADHLVVFWFDYIVNGVSGNQKVLLQKKMKER